MTFAQKTLRFYDRLNLSIAPFKGIEILNSYQNPDTIAACETFYNKFYCDQKNRRIILGINPGRFGAGVTGIPFTDPVRLQENCGISNNFDKRPEISSQFIYLLINHIGDTSSFYRHYYIGAVSPLGFVKNGKNFNYYDDKDFERKLKPFIIKSLVDQIALGIDTEKCFCLGRGKNYEYLKMLNAELKIFGEIVPLPHPRWIMQYRRRQLDQYLIDISHQLSI